MNTADVVKLRGVSATILNKDRNADVDAVALLLIGRPAAAIKLLQAVPEPKRTASEWNDLAAAYYVLSGDGDGIYVKDGLAAAGRAVQRAPRMLEARFNRALLVERLGLRDAACEAWQEVFGADPSSGWAGEARTHLQRLTRSQPQFRDTLEASYATFDDAAARNLVARYPQESRTWGEVEILGHWADATLAGNGSEGDLHLRVARALGHAVQSHGEGLLADAVASIDRAAPDRRRELASAHVAYRRGRIEYSTENPSAAEPLLVKAVELFRRGGSPMSLVARYYVANAAFDSNHIEDARAQLVSLAAKVPPRYAALRAQSGWTAGLCEAALGRLGAAIEAWSDSERLFQQLNERANAASMLGLLADAHDTVGAFDQSWRERIAAVRQIGQTRSPRLATVLSGASRIAVRQHNWSAAAAFLELEIRGARTTGPSQLVVDMLLRRAVVREMLGATADAAADINEARRLTATVPDAFRPRLVADSAWSEALTISNANPDRAVRLFTLAMDFHAAQGRRSFLPDLYLGRARAHLRNHERAAAEHDLITGIEQLETEREAIQAPERLGIFDTVNELFEEAIDVELQSGRVAEAFNLADHSRARGLLDRWGGAYRPVALSRLDPQTTLVEYALVKHRLVVFTARIDGVQAEVTDVEDERLANNIAEFRSALQRDDAQTARRVGAALHTMLIGPSIERNAVGQRLVIVPSGTIELVPFAALLSPATGRFLVQDHTIIVSPSAATYLVAAARQITREPRRLFAIADPQRADAAQLQAARREVEQIARLYPSATILGGAHVSPAALAAEAQRADVIHYAGHAVEGGLGSPAALLLSGQERMDVHAIAGLRLRSSVVVLAACATAAGSIGSTEGVASVARAFLNAGAPAVIATLWPIDDSRAAPLFVRLHHAIAAGVAPADALRTVQIEAIGNPIAARGSLAWTSIRSIGS